MRDHVLVDIGSGPAQSYTIERDEPLSVGDFVRLADGRAIRIVRVEEATKGGVDSVVYAIVTGEIGDGLLGR